MSRLRQIPKVDELLSSPHLVELLGHHPRAVVVGSIRAVLDGIRHRIQEDPDAQVDVSAQALLPLIEASVARSSRPSLRRVINATGVIIHTGLGRARLTESAQRAVLEAARSATCLETDIESGDRLSRDRHVRDLLAELTGAEAATVVNNNAAAVLLAVNTLALGREVVISRGQLVEIGGSFRLPDVVRSAGARLVEVGTTNQTRLSDYEAAIGEATALILWVHHSNYQIVGYHDEPSVADLVALGQRVGVPTMADLGSGALADMASLGVGEEPGVREVIATSVDVATFSGDKLLGAAQAGIAVGRGTVIEAMRRNPLARAIRIDKLCLAGLEATLRAYRDPEHVADEVPVLAAIVRPLEEIDAAARRLADAVGEPLSKVAEVSVIDGESRVGGGSLPTQALPTRLVALHPLRESPDSLARRMRMAEPSVFARIQHDLVLIDPRTVAADDMPDVVLALTSLSSLS
jgi:L-seryl-tRNA(Ser) seleniumtransferase